MDKSKPCLRELIFFTLLGAAAFGAKVAMMGLPNIEPVSLMVLLFGAVFGRRALYPVYTYVALEILLYGVNLWSVNYLYIWAVLALIGRLLRKADSAWVWALASGAYGLCFGLLCAPVYAVVGGWTFAVSWWVAGIPFDLVHGVSNFIIALTLFAPLRRVLQQLYGRICPS